MIPPNFALYFTCLFLTNMAHVTTLKQSSLHYQSCNVGESITLSCICDYEHNTVMLYWYKQTLGQKPNLISTYIYRHANDKGMFEEEFNNDSRFSLDTENGKNHLKIKDLQISDSATYYCVRSDLYDLEFAEGTTVSVKGSGLNIPALVHRSSDTIQTGDSVTLNCTVHTGSCDGEHSVYWFKNSEESHPGLIYTHGGRNDQCERKPNEQTHTCVYNLPMKSLTLSHAGTYYCAVASCGHILFGNGIKLDIEDEVNFPDSLVYFLSGALALTTILIVLLTITVFKMIKTNSCGSESQRVPASNTTHAENYQDADSLHYAALRDHRVDRSRSQRDTNSECVYAAVRL
ncbi:signal-regulatory protein beta-2-like [Cottoperca gobio]|uniref:Signal-regulatory protein beta-2-like n=1 Tax=Cottoperca gobio TaxID=56716 RepID=A0A6J2RP23_COTGO|nr:signal-regulatory protein beta-2-like [Cottoperca gobio]